MGIIEYSDNYDRYEGKFKIKDGELIEFSLDIDDNLVEILKVTRKIIKSICGHSFDFKLYASEKLLDLYKNTWSKNKIIGQTEFAERINLESVVIWNDGSTEIYYQDGDLFAGHSIIIYINSEGKLEDANIAG